MQSLLVQAAQVMGLPQLPVASQVSNVVPLQRVVFGVQSTQCGGGSRHTLAHAMPVFVHAPLSLQVCGCLPEHRCVIGVQAAQLPRTHTGFEPLHGVPSTH